MRFTAALTASAMNDERQKRYVARQSGDLAGA
jgi:hypothetical protein